MTKYWRKINTILKGFVVFKSIIYLNALWTHYKINISKTIVQQISPKTSDWMLGVELLVPIIMKFGKAIHDMNLNLKSHSFLYLGYCIKWRQASWVLNSIWPWFQTLVLWYRIKWGKTYWVRWVRLWNLTLV